MKAIRLHSHGGPEVLSLEEMPIPRPKAGQVLVKADTIGVGKPDVLFRIGNYPWLPPLPIVIGNEMAGHIAELGPDVEGFEVGQPVHVLNTTGGCYAEYAAVPTSALTSLPKGIDIERFVGALNFILAWALLHEVGHVREGQTLYMGGSAGGLGPAVIQLAHLAGVRVIAGASSEEKCAFVEGFGPYAAINYSDKDPIASVLELTGGRGVDLVLDNYIGRDFPRVYDMVATLGTVIVYSYLGGLPEKDVMAPLLAKMGKSFGLRFFSLHCYDDDLPRRAWIFEKVIDLIARGVVTSPVNMQMPLSQARQAHEQLDAGQVLGKLVLKPGV